MNLHDPFWRLENLYSCKGEGHGKPVKFRMRDEQRQVLQYLHGSNELAIIIKARRLGLSTGIGIGMTDDCAWSGGKIARLIERNKDLAGEKMTDIMRLSFNSMPDQILSRFDVKHKDSTALLDPLVSGLGEEFRSKIIAGMSARGGDCAWLWVSEMGKINHVDPKRAEEIRTGALPAARLGRKVIETTWEGGKGGHLWELVKPILERNQTATGRIFFFPWHNDSEYVCLDGGSVPGETESYFRELTDKLGRTFSREQKRWYAIEKSKLGIFIKREMPSTLDEAFTAPVEGAIYADLIDAARAEGRVGPLPVDGRALVTVTGDLGAPDNSPWWFWQVVGRWIHCIDVDVGIVGETISQRISRVLGKGYAFGNFIFPHDAQQTERTGTTFATEVKKALAQAGRENVVRVVPRTTDIWVGINAVRALLPSMAFRAPQATPGVEALEAYHKRKETATGASVDFPVHDWSSHWADGVRVLAEAHLAGMVKAGMALRKAVDDPEWFGEPRGKVKVLSGFRG